MAVDRKAIKEGIRPIVVAFLRQWEGEIDLDGKPASAEDIAVLLSALFRENIAAFAADDPTPEEEELKRILPEPGPGCCAGTGHCSDGGSSGQER